MSWGRAYFALQAVAGAAWWIAVALSPVVREATLGTLDPLLVAAADIPLFVVASALAALGVRAAAWVSAGWTVLVAAAMALYATITTEAGWGALTMIAAAGASVIALSLLVLGRVPTEVIVSGPFAFRLAAPGRSRAAHVAATFGQVVLFWGTFLVAAPLAIEFVEARWGVAVEFPDVVRVVGVVVLVLASAVGVWSAITMSTLGNGTPLPAAMPRRLVIAGPYRYVRNPMAFAGHPAGGGRGAHPLVLAGRRVRDSRLAAVELRGAAPRGGRPRASLRRTVPPVPGRRAVLGAEHPRPALLKCRRFEPECRVQPRSVDPGLFLLRFRVGTRGAAAGSAARGHQPGRD